MKHFVQYHNPDRFATPCAAVATSEFEVATNKRVKDLLGSQLWVICGEERPRRYFLCKTYLVDAVGPYGDDADFRFFVRGRVGIRFQPPMLLNGLPWFHEFCRQQSNFSFGLNRIDEPFVRQLEWLALRFEEQRSIRRSTDSAAALHGGESG
jgi:hypothetical protein